MLAITLLFLALLLLYTGPGAFGEDVDDSNLTNDEIAKLPTKKLRTMLWQRGLECKGCTEKADFIQLLQDHITDPIIQGGSSSRSGSGSDTSDGASVKDKELEDLMKKLEESGMGGGAKVFRPKDFEGLSPEEMAEKVSSSSGSRGYGRKSPKATKPKMTVDADAENIEL